MQQFVVPQFIDVENKIIGPIGTRQFVIFLIGFGLIYISYQIFDFALFIFMAVTLFGLSGVFAFLKINGQGFHYFLLNIIKAFREPSLKVWNKKSLVQSMELKKISEEKKAPLFVKKPPLTTSRLAELSLIVDTGGTYQGEKIGKRKIDIF